MGPLRKYTVAVLVLCGVLTMNFSSVFAAEKPNILVVWGDDIGQSNISRYTHGMMGYQTPNIDQHRPYCRRGYDIHRLLR